MDELVQYLTFVQDDVLKNRLLSLHQGLKLLIDEVPASVKYHHNWTGGYKQHVLQVLRHAISIYSTLYLGEEGREPIGQEKGKLRKPHFSLDDVILVAYIHDLDKLYRYQKLDKPKDGREWEHVKDFPSYDDSAKVVSMCYEYGIVLTDRHLEALAMHHGGWSANPRGRMTPLAVIIHSADMISTHIQTRKGD
jgi:hypothetical protein